jgi:hypothetical protein
VSSSENQSERELSLFEEPPIGAHLLTPRRGFVHHGIYLGAGQVMHCGAAERLIPGGPVEEVSLSRFRRGRPISVRIGESSPFSRHEIVARARSRLGDGYALFTRNCEHFCEWCVLGRPRSYQVERILRGLRPWSRFATEAPARRMRTGPAEALRSSCV